MRLRGPIVAALIGVVLIVLVVVGLVLPKSSQVRNKQNEVTQAEREEARLRLDLQQLRQAAKEAPKDRRRLANLEAQVPPTADLPGLIRLLNSTALRSAVDFMSVSPSPPSPSATASVSIIPTQITVVGAFFAVDQFMFRLERATRASKVTTIAVQAGPNGLPQLQINITADFYTTDSSAGPGSSPGPTEGTSGSGAPATTPTSSPTPTGSASPTTGG